MKDVINTAKDKMGKCVAAVETEYASIRAGRANPAVLDKVTVDYYGVPTQINAMAAVAVSEARVLVITPLGRFNTEVYRKGYTCKRHRNYSHKRR